MPHATASALRPLCLLALGLGLFACTTARADLVWTPDTGWHVVGGALSGLTGPEGNKALALMNKARRAEEKHHYFFALHDYARVVKKYPRSPRRNTRSPAPCWTGAATAYGAGSRPSPIAKRLSPLSRPFIPTLPMANMRPWP